MYQAIFAMCLVVLLSGQQVAAKADSSPSRVRRQISICQLPPSAGPCRSFIPSFFYNAAIGQCQAFTYGGCGGNANRFTSLIACQTTCLGAGNLLGGGLSATGIPGVGLTGGLGGVGVGVGVPTIGLGQGLGGVGLTQGLQTLGLNQGLGGGVGLGVPGIGLGQGLGGVGLNQGLGGLSLRNAVNGGLGLNSQGAFLSNGLLQRDDNCYLPRVTGLCNARVQRWYFNAATSTCQTFIYGGCGGNDNNFQTRFQCQRKCSAFNDGFNNDDGISRRSINNILN